MENGLKRGGKGCKGDMAFRGSKMADRKKEEATEKNLYLKSVTLCMYCKGLGREVCKRLKK